MRVVCIVTMVSLACLLPGAESDTAGERETVVTSLIVAEQKARQSPDSESARSNLASLYLKLNQTRNALSTLTSYLKRHPNSPGILRMAATASLLQEDYPAARDYALRALKSGRDSRAVYVLGMARLGLQETAAAESLLRESARLDPSVVEPTFQLGLLYTRGGSKLPEAVALLERARTMTPGLAGVHTALGSALLQSGRTADAVAELQSATRLDPLSTESWYLLADACKRLGDITCADAALQTFRARNAENADRRAREMRSRAQYDQGVHLLSTTDELDRANEYFRKALSELPELDSAWYRMAQVSFLKNDLRTALRQVREAIRRNPLEAEYYFVEARCLAPSDPVTAQASIRKAIALRPGVADFKSLLRELQTGPRQQ